MTAAAAVEGDKVGEVAVVAVVEEHIQSFV